MNEFVLQPVILQKVESSQIASIGHDPLTNTLVIQFPAKGNYPGSIYTYANFTAEDFEAFRNAPSVGSYFYKFIKPNSLKYPYKKIS